MKQRLRGLTVLLLFFFCGLHGEGSGAKPGMLWRIHGKNADAFLLASIPWIPHVEYPLADSIEKAFQRSSLMILSSYIPPSEEKKTAALFMQKGSFIGETGLRRFLSAATYRIAERHLREYGQDLRNFDKLKPWLLGMQVLVWEWERSGYHMEDSLAKHFSRAVGNRRIEALATVREIVSLVDDPDPLEQDFYLRLCIEQSRLMRKRHRPILQAWRNGDEAALARETCIEPVLMPEVRDRWERLLKARNDIIFPRLIRVLSQGKTVFCVFDVEDLFCSEGILQRLRQEGYKLERVDSSIPHPLH